MTEQKNIADFPAGQQALHAGIIARVDAFLAKSADADEYNDRFEYLFDYYAEDIVEMNRELIRQLPTRKPAYVAEEIERITDENHAEWVEEAGDPSFEEAYDEVTSDDIVERELDMMADCTTKHQVYDFFPDDEYPTRPQPAFMEEVLGEEAKHHADLGALLGGYFLWLKDGENLRQEDVEETLEEVDDLVQNYEENHAG